MLHPHPREGRGLKTLVRFAVLASVLFAGACTRVVVVEQTPGPSTAPPTALESATPGPSGSAAAAELADGRHFGYLRSVDTGAHTFVFDLAEFFTGEAANTAAREDGKIGPGETVDNDYYIRNQNKRLRTLTYSSPAPALKIIDPSVCCDPKNGDFDRFTAAFAPGAHDEAYRGPSSQYWLTVSGGKIVKIDEQYLP